MKKSLLAKALIFFVLFSALLVLCACDSTSQGGTDTAPSDAENTAEPAIYVIVRSDNGNKEETDGAVRLRKYIRETLGIEIELETDWFKRGEDVEDHRFAHEIVFGDTNRNESIAAYDSLNVGTPDMIDYVLSSNDSHYIIAASSGNVDDAVTQFISYLEADPTLLHKSPIAMNDVRAHDFPLDDITVMGSSIADYRAIVYPISYNKQLVSDVQAISNLIYEGMGIRLPLYNEKDNNAPTDGKIIRIGARADEGILNAGSFSYVLDITDNGIILDSADMYNDTRAMEALTTLLLNGINAGGTLALDDSCDVRLENPPDEPRIEIAAWVYGATALDKEEQFAEIKDCGFNQVIINKTSDEELFHKHCKWLAKYELKALWQDGSMYITDTMLDSETTMDQYIDIDENSFLHADITWGNMLRDEPNAKMFDLLAEAYDVYDAKTDDKIPYYNLFPSYANKQQLGTKTYEEHVKQFFDKVDPQLYASVDIYPLNISYSINNDYFYNLDVFATECRNRGIPFAIYIQSVSFASIKRTPNEQEMRWQAYCALSFGAKDIQYFTYCTPYSETEDFKDALVDTNNEKTERWYGAQAVNAALNLMSDTYMQYDNLGAYTVNPTSDGFMKFSNQYKDFDAIADVSVSDNRPVLIGAFASDTAEHSRAFTCVDLGDPGLALATPTEVTVELTDAVSATMYYKDTVTTLTPDENGCITFTLYNGDGVFVTLGN